MCEASRSLHSGKGGSKNCTQLFTQILCGFHNIKQCRPCQVSHLCWRLTINVKFYLSRSKTTQCHHMGEHWSERSRCPALIRCSELLHHDYCVSYSTVHSILRMLGQDRGLMQYPAYLGGNIRTEQGNVFIYVLGETSINIYLFSDRWYVFLMLLQRALASIPYVGHKNCE